MLGKSLRMNIVIALIICVLGASAYAKDFVVVKDKDGENKEYTSAKIINFTQTHLVFENDVMKGDKIVMETVKIKWSDVLSWTIDPDYEKTREFSVGSKNMKEADFRSAMSDFDKVLKNKKSSTIEKHLAYYYIIYCGYEGNNRRNIGFKVIALYAPMFKKDFPNSYFLKDAYDIWGRSLLSQKKVIEAKKIFEELKKYSPALSSMRLAIIIYYANDFEKAAPMFSKAVSTASADKFTRDFSNVLLAHCYQKLNKWAGAKEILEKLTGESDESSNNGVVLGKAFLFLGTEYGRTGDYNKAFIALMKAYTIYKGNLNKYEVVDAFAYALICAQELGKQDENWQKRAKTLEASFKDIFDEKTFENRKTEFPK